MPSSTTGASSGFRTSIARAPLSGRFSLCLLPSDCHIPGVVCLGSSKWIITSSKLSNMRMQIGAGTPRGIPTVGDLDAWPPSSRGNTTLRNHPRLRLGVWFRDFVGCLHSMPQPFGSPENAGSSASWLLKPGRSLSSKLRPASPHVKRKDDQGTHRGKQQAALLSLAASGRHPIFR